MVLSGLLFGTSFSSLLHSDYCVEIMSCAVSIKEEESVLSEVQIENVWL